MTDKLTEAERQAFEQYVDDQGIGVERLEEGPEAGQYYEVQDWWEVWQARAAHEEELVTLLKDIVEWEADYRKINNLGKRGPEWVERAEAVLRERGRL